MQLLHKFVLIAPLLTAVCVHGQSQCSQDYQKALAFDHVTKQLFSFRDDKRFQVEFNFIDRSITAHSPKHMTRAIDFLTVTVGCNIQCPVFRFWSRNRNRLRVCEQSVSDSVDRCYQDVKLSSKGKTTELFAAAEFDNRGLYFFKQGTLGTNKVMYGQRLQYELPAGGYRELGFAEHEASGMPTTVAVLRATNGTTNKNPVGDLLLVYDNIYQTYTNVDLLQKVEFDNRLEWLPANQW